VYTEQGATAKKRGAGYVHYAPTKERPIRFWRSLCFEKKNEREKQTDRQTQQQLCSVERTKESVTFRFLKPTTSNSTRRIVYEERRRRCCFSPFFFLSLSSFSRGARSHAHKTPRSSQAKPSPLEKGVIQVAFLFSIYYSPLCPSPERYPGNGSTSRTSFVESTRHSNIHSCLPSSFYIQRGWILFLFFVLCLVANERESEFHSSRFSFFFLYTSQSSHLPRYSLNYLSTISAF
jgi:hypothetical protein